MVLQQSRADVWWFWMNLHISGGAALSDWCDCDREVWFLHFREKHCRLLLHYEIAEFPKYWLKNDTINTSITDILPSTFLHHSYKLSMRCNTVRLLQV